MVLSFMQKFPNKRDVPDSIRGKETHFINKIYACVPIKRLEAAFGSGSRNLLEILEHRKSPKKHTIRKGNRWRAGLDITMVHGSRMRPYVFSDKGCFPEIGTCKSVQTISITWPDPKQAVPLIIINDKELKFSDHPALAINDGFLRLIDFYAYFSQGFEGQIIHWTDLKY